MRRTKPLDVANIQKREWWMSLIDCVLYVLEGLSLGWVSPTHCRQHKEEGMSCNRSKKCQECNDKATVGYATVTHCANHAKVGMVDLSIRCLQCGLRMVSSKPRYVNYTDYRKLNCLVCEAEGCIEKASYDSNGVKCDKPVYCKYHIPVKDPIQIKS